MQENENGEHLETQDNSTTTENNTTDPQKGDNSVKEKNSKEVRYLEQMKGRKSKAEKLQKELEDKNSSQSNSYSQDLLAVKADSTALAEVYETNPKRANRIARSFGYQDYDEYFEEADHKDALKIARPDLFKKKSSKSSEEITSEVEKKLEHKYALKSAAKSFKSIDDKEKAKIAQEEFDELTEGKTLNDENIDKYIKKALRYAGVGTSTVPKTALYGSLGSKGVKQGSKGKYTMKVVNGVRTMVQA